MLEICDGAKTGMVYGVKTSPTVELHYVGMWAQSNHSIKVKVSHAKCQMAPQTIESFQYIP